MWTTEIEEILKSVPGFLGVYSRDNLPKPPKYPYSLVVNTDKQVESGTHWIAIYVDKNDNGMYFDSYGNNPLNYLEFKRFLGKFTKKFTWNKKQLQCTLCVTCGEYCCAYILLRHAGISHANFISLFSENTVSNDYIVKNIFNSID